MTFQRRRAAWAAVILVLAFIVWLRTGPLPAGLLSGPQAESTMVLDRRGEILYEARAGDGTRASWIAADQVPATLIEATLAAEDHRFWRHPGVDPIAIGRAAIRDLRNRRVVEGGSTITQQVAKLLVARLSGGASRRGIMAKMREAVIALRLEHRFTKREILALYLNLASYGNQLTGAERASLVYFGRPAALTTPAQAAFLAALPQRPSSFNPYRDPSRARRRQEWVIVQMGLRGGLTPDGVREALDERVSLEREPAAFIAPHFVERVLALAGPARPRSIVTTLDADLQRAVQGIIRAQRPALEKAGAHNVAAVVLDNASGEWLAWEGSGDHSDAGHGGAIDGVITPRQPGSALKPFTYALAFEEGDTPATVLPDIPSYFPTAEEGILYSPKNYDNTFRGPLLARRALAGSENVPAVALASRLGVANLLRFLRAAGFGTFEKSAAYYGLGVTLGDAEVRLDQLVTAYASFARGGLAVQPTFIRVSPPTAPRDEPRLMSPRTAFWITDILSDDDARAFAFGRGGSLEFPFPVAAKTGTSQAYRDNWAIGYTRRITVGVWVGNFDRRPLVGSSGVSGAGPIFHAIMLAAERRAGGSLLREEESATIAEPDHTVRRPICALSGMAATRWCPTQTDEWQAADASAPPCTWHRATARGVVVDWPTEYLAWARAHPLDRAAAAPLAAAVASSPVTKTETRLVAAAGARPLQIASPPSGAVYLIDPTLRREFQTLPLRATAVEHVAIEWRVDGAVVGRGPSESTIDWPLAAGRHVITVRDGHGHQGSAAIVVK